MLNTLLIDRYQITAELGQGGMGAVYLALDTYLEREVAVKVMNSHRIGTEGRALLLHEARAAARLSHPNVAMVFDMGEHEATPFVVMEYVPGQVLSEWKPARLNDVVRITRQVCAALAHAHQKDLIHRDVKPGNVIVTEEGVAKLMDFGLARALNARVEPEASFAGTVSYVAPEQALGEEVDHRADLYALGVMLYELCTGRLPFLGTPVQVIIQHVQEIAPEPREINPELPSALNELIVHLMEKNPADRPASAASVGHLLEVLSDLYRLSFVRP